eukprot:SAG31_NODE_3415_length_4302_cov_12.564359_2_plen_93_part_00
MLEDVCVLTNRTADAPLIGFDVKGYLHLKGLFSSEQLHELALGDDSAARVLEGHSELSRYLALLMAEGNLLQPGVMGHICGCKNGNSNMREN